MIASWHLILAVAALAYLAVASIVAAWQVARPDRWQPILIRVMTAHGIGAGGLVVFWRAFQAGNEQAFRHSFDSVSLFATLVAVLAMANHLRGGLRGLYIFLLPVATLLQAGAFLTVNQQAVGYAYRPWFITHMASLILGATCFAAGGVAGMAYLMVHHRLRARQPTILLGKMAPLESLEQFGRRTMVVGFVLLSFGVLTGFCGIAHQQQWRPFLSDPLVIFTLLMWLLYAAALTGIWLKPELRGRRAAWLAILSFILLVGVFVVADLFSSTH